MEAPLYIVHYELFRKDRGVGFHEATQRLGKKFIETCDPPLGHESTSLSYQFLRQFSLDGGFWH